METVLHMSLKRTTVYNVLAIYSSCSVFLYKCTVNVKKFCVNSYQMVNSLLEVTQDEIMKNLLAHKSTY